MNALKTLKSKLEWIDLSNHEELNEKQTQTEDNVDADTHTESEQDSVESNENNSGEEEEGEYEHSEEEEDHSESENNGEDTDEGEHSENENDGEDTDEGEHSESENDEEDTEQHVCVVYDSEYRQENKKYLFIGYIANSSKTWVEIDFGTDEGVHLFHRAPSCDFTRNTFKDESGWVVRIHKIHYDYELQKIVDDTYNQQKRERVYIPTSLQMPTLSVIGYLLFIALIVPAFNSVC